MKVAIHSPPSKLSVAVTISLIVLGAVLRLRAYLADRSLWLDELFLWSTLGEAAPTTIDHWLRFSRPLEEGQVAAPGFVLLVQIVRACLGDSELALRFLPMICGVAALPLTASLARRIVGSIGVGFAVAIVAFAPSAIYFSADFKPYSLDLCVTMVLLTMALDRIQSQRRWIDGRMWMAGIVAVFVSIPALLVLAGIGFVFAMCALPEFKSTLRNVGLAGSWAVWFAAQFLILMPSVHDNRYLMEYWSHERAFPMSSELVERAAWTGDALLRALSNPTGFGELWGRPTWTTLVAAAFFVIGACAVFRSERRVGVVLFAPILCALIAAHLGRYPFQGRVLSFLAPSFVCGVAIVIDRLARPEGRRNVSFALLCAAALLVEPAMGAVSRLRTPQLREESRPVLAELSRQIRAGDVVYTSRFAGFAWRYYAARFGLAESVVLEAPDIPDDRLEEYVTDLARRAAGRERVWWFVTHYYPENDIREQVLSLWVAQGCVVSQRIDAEAASATLIDTRALRQR